MGTSLTKSISMVCVRKRKPRGFQISNKNTAVQIWILSEESTKLSHYLIFLEKHQPGMLLPGHPGGVNWYEQCVWIVTQNCDLDQQADCFTRAFLGDEKINGFKISPILANLCHMQDLLYDFLALHHEVQISFTLSVNNKFIGTKPGHQ